MAPPEICHLKTNKFRGRYIQVIGFITGIQLYAGKSEYLFVPLHQDEVVKIEKCGQSAGNYNILRRAHESYKETAP